MVGPDRSPVVTELDWGCVWVAGCRFKDVKIWPGGVREWDWNETGTRHDPGIQPADVEELVESQCAIIVLSRGLRERLLVAEETFDYLESTAVDVVVARSDIAVDRFNDIANSGIPVGLLLHSTC